MNLKEMQPARISLEMMEALSEMGETEIVKGVLPLYYRVANALRARIERGIYEENSFLPSEQELGKEFNVSRITIKQALSLLRREGLIYSRSGYGTVVRPNRNGRRPYMRVFGSLKELSEFGHSTVFQPVSREAVAAPKFVAEKLQCEPGTEVIRYSGVRSQPDLGEIVYTEAFILSDLCQDIQLEMIKLRPLFTLLQELRGLQITDAEQTMAAVSADQHVAGMLKVKRSTPLLKVTRTYFLADGKPVEVAISWHNTNKVEPVIHLGQEG
jgi:GntR family transcriptional regulator